MLMDGVQAASFIPTLYHIIQARGLNSTGIACCDSMGWDNQVNMTSQIQSAGAEKYLSRITSHWYSSQCSAPISTSLRVWETEFADLSGAWSTDWRSSDATGDGITWANYIHKGLTNCNLSGFLYWWGAETNTTQNGALINLLDGGPVPSGRLWAFGMYSRFVRPDAVRVATSGAPTGVNLAAFKNTDGSVSIIVINTNSTPRNVTTHLSGFAVSSASAYILSNSMTGIQETNATVGHSEVFVYVPEYAMITVICRAQSPTGFPSQSNSLA
jgi:O-glycosyl hydrolase